MVEFFGPVLAGWLAIVAFCGLLALVQQARTVAIYLGMIVTGAIVGCLGLGWLTAALGWWWLEANPHLSEGNDGPGLLLFVGVIAVGVVGVILGGGVGAFAAHRLTWRRSGILKSGQRRF